VFWSAFKEERTAAESVTWCAIDVEWFNVSRIAKVAITCVRSSRESLGLPRTLSRSSHAMVLWTRSVTDAAIPATSIYVVRILILVVLRLGEGRSWQTTSGWFGGWWL